MRHGDSIRSRSPGDDPPAPGAPGRSQRPWISVGWMCDRLQSSCPPLAAPRPRGHGTRQQVGWSGLQPISHRVDRKIVPTPSRSAPPSALLPRGNNLQARAEQANDKALTLSERSHSANVRVAAARPRTVCRSRTPVAPFAVSEEERGDSIDVERERTRATHSRLFM